MSMRSLFMVPTIGHRVGKRVNRLLKSVDLTDTQSVSYFFLNPAGHLGFIAVTFLTVFPLMQVMDVFFVVSTIVKSNIKLLAGL